VRAEVLSGQFASPDDAVAQIVREYFRRRSGQPTATPAADETKPTLGSIGAMRDAANELDEIVADAMQKRQASAVDSTAVDDPSATTTTKPVWERILERVAQVPDEEFDKLPTDLAEQHDHYLYGTPKRPTR
jgi:hypothetical protein